MTKVFEDEEYLDLLQDEDQTNPFQTDESTVKSETSCDAGEGSSKQSSDYFFVFTGVFFRRLYRGQLRPREFAKRNVEGDSINDVFECIWNAANSQIQRQIVFDDEAPKWWEQQHLDPDDIDLFITLYDETKKKTYAPSAVTPRVLATWSEKSIKIYAYAYSVKVETAAQYQLVLRQLIAPLQLSKYFRWTAVSEPVRLHAAHRGLMVAHTVNDRWMQEFAELKSDVDRAFDIMQSVRQRISSMAARGSTGTQLFTAMEDAVRPEESELSRELAEKVTDCQEVDHS